MNPKNIAPFDPVRSGGFFNKSASSHRFFRTCTLAACFVIFLFGTACKKNHDGIRVAISGNIQSFDPILASDEASVTAQGLIHETLYQPHYLSQPIRQIPWLAADFPLLEPATEKLDGIEKAIYSIIIRPEVKYHSRDCVNENTALTAEHFVQAWNRFAKLDSIHPAKSGFLSLIKSWTAAGNNKLLITTAFDKKWAIANSEAAKSKLVEVLSQGFSAPVLENCPESGTGPYVFTKQRTRVEYQFKKNPKYHPQFFPTSADPSFNQKEFLEDLGRHLPLNEGVSLLIVDRPGDYWTLFAQGVLDISPLPWIVWSHHLRVLKPSGDWVMEPEKTVLGARVNIENSANVVVLVLGNNASTTQSNPALFRNQFSQYLQKKLKAVSLIPSEVQRFADLPEAIKSVCEKSASPAPEVGKKNIAKKLKSEAASNFSPPKVDQILVIDIVGARKWERMSASLIAQALSQDGYKVEVRENSVEHFSRKINSGDYTLAIRPVTVSNTKTETLKSEILKMPEAIYPLWLERGVWLSQASILNFRSDTQIRNRFAFVRQDESLGENKKEEESH